MRCYRDWQFFNRKPAGSALLMQACFSGHLWDFGFGLDPARVWLGRLSRRKPGKYAFHFHTCLPFNKRRLPWRPSIGFRRRNGEWINLLSNAGRG